MAEIRKWLGDERLRVYAVGAKKPVADFHHSIVYPVMIVRLVASLDPHTLPALCAGFHFCPDRPVIPSGHSYDTLRLEIEQLSRTSFGLIMCDEGHRLKNENAKTTRALASLPARRRVILTGKRSGRNAARTHVAAGGLVFAALTVDCLAHPPHYAGRNPRPERFAGILCHYPVLQSGRRGLLRCI